MILHQVLGLLDHLAEEFLGGPWEVSLHVLHVIRGKRKDFRLLNRLDTEVAAVENAEAILLETEVAIFSVFIMHHRSDIHNDIFSAEVLQHRELFGALFQFFLLSCEVDDWIDNLYQLVIQVGHDKRANTADGEVEVVD